MSCPSWRPALERRDADLAGWRAARVHLDECFDCRREALALEPTLVFEGAGRIEVTDDEIATLRRSIHSARRARETERSLTRPLSGAGGGMVAAALLAMVLLLPATISPPRALVQELPAVPALVAPRVDEAASPSPLIEALDRPQARIYQLGEDDLSVVMIVDESLDV